MLNKRMCWQVGIRLWQLLMIIIPINASQGSVSLSPTAVWAQNASTVAGKAAGTSGSSNGYLNNPGSITISTDDILYIADQDNNRVVVVNLTSSTIIRNIGSGPGSGSSQFNWPNDISVTTTSIYVLDSENYRVQKWSINGTNPTTVPGTGSISYSFYMFIDKYGSLYVSSQVNNTVIRFAANSSVSVIIAGTGSSGAQSNRLNSPYGIFVDDNRTLYIADYGNHRIQMWKYGALSGSTVAGTGTSGPSLTQLDNPSAVVVDTNGYMYIVDTENERILRWPPNSTSGVCIAACTGTSGTSTNKLNWPSALAFDSDGSLYVCDLDNNRIQKFQILDNQNEITSTSQTTSKSTIETSQVPSTAQPSSLGLTTQMLTSTIVSTSVIPIQSSTIIQSTFASSTKLLQTTTMNPATTSITIITSEIPSSNNYVETSVPPAQSTTTLQSTLAATTILLETTTSKTSTTSQISSTNNRVDTSVPSTQSTTIPGSTLDLTTTLLETTITSQISSTNNRVDTSVPSTQSTTIPGSTLDLTTTLLETTTSETRTTSQISSTDNYVETSVPTAQSTTTLQSTSTSPAILLEITTLKTITTSPISSTDNYVETSVPTAQSTTTLQSTLTSTTTLLETTTSETSITSQISSTDNHLQTSVPSVQSTLTSTMTLVETTTSTTIMTTSVNPLQTSEHTNILSTKIWPTTTQEISTSSTMQSSVTDLLSTKITTESPTSWTSIDNTSTMNTSNCSKAIISLWPNNPLLTTPLEIERSEAFSISSSLQLHCIQSLTVIEQWSIEKCFNSLCSISEQMELSFTTFTLGELFVPSKTLDYGIYQIKLTVKMSVRLELISSAVTFVEIIPSSIQVQLIQFGPSIIIRGQEQTLILDPGTFSIDPDQTYFNSNNWNYTYFCQIYDYEMVPGMNETMLSIDDTTNSHSCFNSSAGNKTLWQYGTNLSRSSLMIYGGSLSSNQTYHFKVELNNIQNSSIVYNGDLLVQIEDKISMTIVIKCVISPMCISNNEYVMINPTTQIALTSFCIDNCYNLSSNIDIEWNIYYGIVNSTNNFVQWIMFDNKTQYINTWFFGMNTSNFTATTDLVLTYSSIKYWRFEVIYSTGSMKSVGLINFMINSPPSNGSCSIYPLSGTTITLFTITCSNWFDSDGIKDYSFYSWTTNRSDRLILAYNTSTSVQVRMPIGDDLNSTLLQILVRVRDQFDCSAELDLSPISIIPDMNNTVSLITTMGTSDYSNAMTSNPFVYILYSGNQNDVCQVLISLSQVLNIFAQQNLQLAMNNNISAVSISVSPLNQDNSVINNYSWISYNETFNLTVYNYRLNTFAAVQEYLMLFINNLTITMIDSVILQSSTLSQLTATTNQLTRNTLIIASTRCLELSQVLLNYAETNPYEDIQNAATYIAQCASNVLTAVNAPLQDRTIVLELDTNRANAFPADYDTDLESVWSQLNLFADGNDISEETIGKNRNIYYQQQLAVMINKQFEETMLMITNALNIHQNIEQSSLINTSSIIMSLKRLASDTLSNQMIQLNNNTQIQLPEDLHLNSTISLRCIQTPLSITGNRVQANMNMSNLLLITIFDENNNEIPVNTTAQNSIELFIPRDINMIIPSMSLQNVSSLTDDPLVNNHQFNLHFVNITQSNTNITVSIHFEMHPLDNTLGYMLIYKFDDIPQLNSSINQIDDWAILCPKNLTNDDLLTYFIDNEKSFQHESVIFGIRELNTTEFEIYCVNMSKNILITDRYFNFSSNYELRIFTSGCYYLDSNNNWQSNGLLVGSLTTHLRTQCFSTHLSTFAGGFIVLPEPINWNYVFANANFVKNKTIYLTIIVIILMFIILSIYGRYLDKKDHKKLEVTFLSNNQGGGNYFYQIVVFTGIRRHAGTSAKVHFILSGDDHETDACTLTNPDRKILERGSIDSFVFGVSKPLGLLNYMRIWHDNSGRHSASSWFLKYIIIRDLQTMQKFYFIGQQWFSIEKGDGKIERVLPVSDDDQMRKLVYSLPEKAYHRLSDDHLWFSIFSRPPSTKFTRVQRCICCFVLLFTVMLLNILYYDQEQEVNINTKIDGFSIGPFYFTKQQVVIGIITDILIFIPSTLLVTFFRRIRQRRSSNQISSIIEKISKSRTNQTSEILTEKTGKKSPMLFPWWCLFIAYSLSYLLIGVSILLILARGIEFGDTKIQKWLASLTIGFFSSILLSQPIKVLGVALFLVMVNRCSNANKKYKNFIDENEEFYLNGGEEQIHSIENNTPTPDQNFTKVRPLSKTKVAEARTIRLREINMWSFIQQLLLHGCFLVVLYTVSYANRNPYSYQQIDHLRNFFFDSNNPTQNYLQILTIDDYWTWLENSFVSNIRAQSWYNEDPPQGLTGFINDKANRLIGWPVMNQLRIKSDSTCRVPVPMRKLISECNGDYSSSNEDHQTWFPGWRLTNDNNISYSKSIQNAFVYQSSNELDNSGYEYEFRGRLNEMQSNLTVLRNLSWIDSLTRVVIIQLTLYNPNVELFTSITFLSEFLSTGGIVPQSRFDAIDLFDHSESVSSIVNDVAALIYMLFIIYFTLIEIHSFIKLKKKYFHSIWPFIQWGIIICSWTGLGIYIWRFFQGSRLRKIFQQTNGYQYVNIQSVVYVDQILSFLFGFSCFLSTIKYLHLFRFHPRLSQFGKTLSYVKKDLFYFGCTFFLVYIAFVCLFYLLFSSKIQSCSDIFRTAEMLFQMLLLKVSVQDLYQADNVLGPLVFASFIYFLVFICFTMIISIINDGFRHIRSINKSRLNEDEDVLMFIFNKMKRAFGVRKKNDKIQNLENQNSAVELCDKIDRFAIRLNKSKMIPSNSPELTTRMVTYAANDIYVEDIE